MSGGVSSYAALCARVRVKYARLLSAADIRLLGEAADLDALVETLKRTPYGAAIEELRDLQNMPSALSMVFRSHQAAEARSVIQAAPGTARRVLRQLDRRHEVNNLKAVLRGIAAGGPQGGEGALGIAYAYCYFLSATPPSFHPSEWLRQARFPPPLSSFGVLLT